MWKRVFWEKWRMSGQGSPRRSRIQKVCGILGHDIVWSGSRVSTCLRERDRQSEDGRQVECWHYITAQHERSIYSPTYALRDTSFARAVRKVSSHFEYLENRSSGLDVTWQPVRGDLTVHPWSHSLVSLVSRQWDAIDWGCVLCDRRIHKSPFQRRN
jgi:hypothetical protein